MSKNFIEYIANLKTIEGSKIAIKQFSLDGIIEEYSYCKLLQDVESMSGSLCEKNVAGKHIAIWAENSYEWIRTFLAIVNIGAIAVPLDVNLSVENAIALLKHGDVEYIFYSARKSDDVLEIEHLMNIKSYNINDRLTHHSINNCGHELIHDDDLCMMVFTSGTTSAPKAVMLSHKNIISVVYDAREKRNNIDFETILSFLPYSHLYALTCEILCSLDGGNTIVINNGINNLIKNMSIFSPKMMFVVPDFVEKLYRIIQLNLKHNRTYFLYKIKEKISRVAFCIGIDIRRKMFRNILDKFGGKIEIMICGGAYLNPKYIKFFNNIGVNMLNGYGMTECSPLIASVRANTFNKTKSVGLPLTCCTVKIQNPNRKGQGEICVSGDNVFMCYYKRNNNVDDIFDGKWLNTGDMGYLDKKGRLYLIGRKKNLIVLSTGQNVSPEEIEEIFKESDLIENIIIKQNKNHICAYVLPNLEIIKDKSKNEIYIEIQNEVYRLNKKISAYKRVSNVVVEKNDYFERTSSGKLRR